MAEPTGQSDASQPTVNGALEADAKAFAKAVIGTYFERSVRGWVRVDRFSTWTLGGAAAAVALVVGNLSALRAQMGQLSIHITVWALAASVFAGLVQKYFAVLVSMDVAFSEAGNAALEEHLNIAERLRAAVSDLPPDRMTNEFLLPLFKTIANELDPGVPKRLRFLVRRAIRKSLLTQQESPRARAFRALVWQLMLVFAQLALLAIAVVVATIAV